MSRFYLDTSAGAKLLVAEAETNPLAAWADEPDVDLVATLLVETELRRFAHRHEIPQSAVTDILDRVWLHELPASLFREAGVLPGARLRSLDALHLAGALRLDVDSIVTYDSRLASAAADVGIAVHAPTTS